MQKVCYICKKPFSTDKNDKNVFRPYHKVRDAHSIYNLRYKTPKEYFIIFHNGSKYDYHFIINQLAKESDGQLECLEENTEKHITFPVSTKKRT